MRALGDVEHECARTTTTTAPGDLSGGLSVPWVRLGENVGLGADVAMVHQAMVASPTHYENLVDPGFSSIGVGVVASGGTLYVAEEFMQL